MIEILEPVLSFVGVCITAWVAYKIGVVSANVGVIAHQTNSMQHEMQELAEAKGAAGEREKQRQEESGSGAGPVPPDD